MVEAAGVEPASESVSLALLRACSAFESRHGPCPRTGQDHRQFPVGFSRSLPETRRQSPACCRRPDPPRRRKWSDVAGVKPRGPIRRWLLCLFSRMIHEANRGPRHATQVSTDPSKPCRPHFHGVARILCPLPRRVNPPHRVFHSYFLERDWTSNQFATHWQHLSLSPNLNKTQRGKTLPCEAEKVQTTCI